MVEEEQVKPAIHESHMRSMLSLSNRGVVPVPQNELAVLVTKDEMYLTNVQY